MRTPLALLLSLGSPWAAASCIAQSYELSGAVVDAQGAPLSGAMVGVAWTKWGAPQGPVIVVTDSGGRYSVVINFDTWSGMSEWGDDCDAKLSQLSVSAYTRTGYALSENVAVGEQERIIVPILQVTQEIQQERGQ